DGAAHRADRISGEDTAARRATEAQGEGQCHPVRRQTEGGGGELKGSEQWSVVSKKQGLGTEERGRSDEGTEDFYGDRGAVHNPADLVLPHLLDFVRHPPRPAGVVLVLGLRAVDI